MILLVTFAYTQHIGLKRLTEFPESRLYLFQEKKENVECIITERY